MPTMHDRRSVRLSGCTTVRKVRKVRAAPAAESVTDFARKADGASVEGGGYYRRDRETGRLEWNTAYREGRASGAPSIKSRRSGGQDAGHRVRMGWQSLDARLKAGVIDEQTIPFLLVVNG